MAEFNIGDVPVIGPWSAKIGQVVDIVAIPCAISPQIWVKAFVVSVPKMAWSLFKPDPMDTVFERAGRPHRKKRRMKFSIGGLIEPDFIPKKGLQTLLFTGAQIAQRVGWYMLIIDAGLDLAVNWTSTAYEYAGCLGGDEGPCVLEQTLTYPVSPGESGKMLLATIEDPSGWSLISGILVPAGVPHVVAGSLNVKPFLPDIAPQGSVVGWIKNETTGQIVNYFPPQTPTENGDETTAFFKKFPPNFAGPTEYRFYIECTGGFADLQGSRMTGSVVDGKSILEDPL